MTDEERARELYSTLKCFNSRAHDLELIAAAFAAVRVDALATLLNVDRYEDRKRIFDEARKQAIRTGP